MAKIDFEIIRGDTESLTVTFVRDGEPVDLTGATVFFTAKPALTNDAGDTTAVIKTEVTDHTDPTEGETVIPLSSTLTNVTPGTYYYDLQVKASNGDLLSIKPRQLKVVGDITRRIE